MYKLLKIEQETIITYNQGEKEADVFTYDKTLQAKLDNLLGKNKDIRTKGAHAAFRDTGAKVYLVPKKWIKVSPPRVVSEENRKRLSERMLSNPIRKT